MASPIVDGESTRAGPCKRKSATKPSFMRAENQAATPANRNGTLSRIPLGTPHLRSLRRRSAADDVKGVARRVVPTPGWPLPRGSRQYHRPICEDAMSLIAKSVMGIVTPMLLLASVASIDTATLRAQDARANRGTQSGRRKRRRASAARLRESHQERARIARLGHESGAAGAARSVVLARLHVARRSVAAVLREGCRGGVRESVSVPHGRVAVSLG